MRAPTLIALGREFPPRLLLRSRIPPSSRPVAAQEEFAADLHARRAVVFDDVGGGVGLAPGLGKEAAGADHVDRRLRLGHDAALADAEARRGDDAHAREAGL